MESGAIVLLDSGIGGLSLLKDAVKTFVGNDFIYFGDNNKAPYGNRTERELEEITFKNLQTLSLYRPKLVVFACNTLSVTVLNKMRPLFGFPIVGVFPPVLFSLLHGGKTLLLSTDRTAEKYSNVPNLRAIGLSSLVSEIEKKAADITSVDVKKYLPSDASEYHSVILGCTHFLFVKKQIIDHLKPRYIFDGGQFTLKKTENILQSNKSSIKNRGNEIFFVGENASYNRFIWNKCGHYL